MRFASAILVGIAFSYFMGVAFDSAVDMRSVAGWLNVNLGISAPLFALLSALGWTHLSSLKKTLRTEGDALTQIAHLEQRLDLVIALLFGVGVLYTAVGLRGALIQAIDTPSEQSASGMLAALVNGGILSAMTSTVVGGVLGYGLRILKLLHVGHALDVYYATQERQAIERRENLLREILAELKQGNPNYGS